MPHIEIPSDLLQQIESVLPPSTSVDGFVREAVREKIAWTDRRKDFIHLSDQVRHAMEDRGLTEQEILDDFEQHRRNRSE